MDALQETLAALRAACHQPSRQSWSRLCNALQVPLAPASLQIALDYAAPLLETWPPGLRRVTAKQWRRIARQGGCPWWPLVRRAELRLEGARDARTLAALSQQGQLESLRMDKHPLSEEACHILAGSALPQHLRRWSLQRAALKDAQLGALLSRPWPALERLNVSQNLLRLRLQARHWDHLPALRQLDLSYNNLSVDAVASLARHGLAQLHQLDLRGAVPPAHINPHHAQRCTAMLKHLAQSPRMACLREIHLPMESVQEAERALWARFQPAAPARLVVDRALLRSGALAVMASQGKLGQVERLELVLEGEDASGLQSALAPLLQARGLSALRSLHLRAALDEATFEALLAAPWVQQLTELTLVGLDPARGDAWAAALAGCAGLAGLEALELPHLGITDSGARDLRHSPHLEGLRRLSLWGDPLSEGGCLELLEGQGGAPKEVWLDPSLHGPVVAARLARHATFQARQPPRARHGDPRWDHRYAAALLDAGRAAGLPEVVPPRRWRALAAWWSARRVTELYLVDRPICAEGAAHLAQAPLGCARRLWLGPRVSAQALLVLLQAPWVASLEALHLEGVSLTPEVVEVILGWSSCQIGALRLDEARGLSREDRARLRAWAAVNQGCRLWLP